MNFSKGGIFKPAGIILKDDVEHEAGLTKLEKRTLQTSVLMMLVFAFFAMNDLAFNTLFGGFRNSNGQLAIADIVYRENDVRQKAAKTYLWMKVAGVAVLENGDSVFTGKKSKSTVQLRNGVRIDVDEESLIKFQGNANEIADLKFGSIHLEGSGDVNIRVNGQPVRIPMKGVPVDLKLEGTTYKVKASKPRHQVAKPKPRPKENSVVESIASLFEAQPEMIDVAHSEPPVATTSTQPPPAVGQVESKPIAEEKPVAETKPSSEVAAENQRKVVPQPVADVKVQPTVQPVPDVQVTAVPEEPPLQVISLAPLPVPAIAPIYPPVLLPPESSLDQPRWHLYDLYDRQGDALRVKSQVHFIADQKVLQWKDLHEGKYHLQLARDSEFKEPAFENVTAAHELKTKNAYIGANYWRVARDNGPWSEPQRFDVRPAYVEGAPALKVSGERIPIFDQPVETKIEWSTPEKYKATLVEISEDASFQADQVLVKWSNHQNLSLSWPRGGRYFVRLRGVTAENEIGVPSSVAVYDVSTPPLLGKVGLPKERLVYTLSQKSKPQLYWKRPAGAKSLAVEIFSKDGNKVAELQTDQERVSFEKQEPGKYSYRVTAIDQWNRRGEVGPVKNFELRKSEPITEKPREIASQAAEAPLPQLVASPLLTPPEAPVFRNGKYDRSVFAMEGASFGMLSSQQQVLHQSSALAATAAVRWKKWWNNLGLEWSFKTKVFGYNVAGNQESPTTAEAYGAWRTHLPWTWFHFLRELQVSGLAGAEIYRNSAAAKIYSSGYNLAKFGTALDFPLASRWGTGGELWYGVGADSSKKYEISGYLHYFVKPEMTFGVGYRAHAFEAGSLSSAPTLPYREAYGEGYTTLQFHY